MNSTIRFVTALGLLTAVAAFGGISNADVVQGYAGDPYLGRVDVRIQVPGERESQDSGTGSAQLTKTDNGQTRLVVSGSIRKASDTGFVMDGSASKSGWNSRDGSLNHRCRWQNCWQYRAASLPYPLKWFRFRGKI